MRSISSTLANKISRVCVCADPPVLYYRKYNKFVCINVCVRCEHTIEPKSIMKNKNKYIGESLEICLFTTGFKKKKKKKVVLIKREKKEFTTIE